MMHRALIFGDDANVRRLLWTLFDRRGYEVFSYLHPGVCPLNAVEQCPCAAGAICSDVIVSDIQMQRVNGIDLVQYLIEKKCKRPHFAVISQCWTEPDRKRAQQIGCKPFEKPLAILGLIEWLDQCEVTISSDRALFDLVVSPDLRASRIDAVLRNACERSQSATSRAREVV